MCIIVAKEKKVKAPSIDTLKTCFYNNNDGAGFMYVVNNKVVIDKGYMTFKSFEKHYKKLLKKYHNFENKSLVIHFRIGTSGQNTQGNTHPFACTDNIIDMKKTYFLTDLGITHNGIISDYTIKNNNIHDISDTMNFVKSFLAPLYKGYKEFYKNSDIMEGIEKLIGSKLCLLDSKDNLYYIGDFVSDTNGVKYSNNTYKNNWWSDYNYNHGYSYNSNDFYTEYEKSVKESKTNDYIPSKGDLVQLDSDLYVSYSSGHYELASDNLYYDMVEGDLYELYDGELEFIKDNVLVYNKKGELAL